MVTVNNRILFENLFDRNLSIITNNQKIGQDEKEVVMHDSASPLILNFSNKFRKSVSITNPANITVKLSLFGKVLNVLVILGLVFVLGVAFLMFKKDASQLLIRTGVLAWVFVMALNFWGMRNNYDLDISNQP